MWKAYHSETKVIYAIKKIVWLSVDKNNLLKRLLKTEVTIMKDILHPNIVHLFEFLVTLKHYYLVIEYCN